MINLMNTSVRLFYDIIKHSREQRDNCSCILESVQINVRKKINLYDKRCVNAQQTLENGVQITMIKSIKLMTTNEYKYTPEAKLDEKNRKVNVMKNEM